jgi:hypothetical protein
MVSIVHVYPKEREERIFKKQEKTATANRQSLIGCRSADLWSVTHMAIATDGGFG